MTPRLKLNRRLGSIVTLYGALFFLIIGNAQYVEEKNTSKIRLGVNLGVASQDIFPLNNPDYLYENWSAKIQVSTPLWHYKKFRFNILLEPSIYFSEHQLLNKFFIQPRRGENYLEQREQFTKRTSFEEFVLNAGILVQFNEDKFISPYLLGSVGPMISNYGTERLKKGFAFSDVLAIGFFTHFKPFILDLRFTLRHNSNANLGRPNNGHNSAGIETGISFKI